ncbi:arylamine N-acetyltransferase [Nocardioides ungokensis]|uniref:arylamine N-acetyltransferase n=1 Tax=Nocardioides ungokensis TaxID=1643322 RepID=UPI003CCE4549
MDALRRLVQRHAERVPYETWWIAAGERWDTDPVRAAERIALKGRGGYCYHLNGALGLLLSSLGYVVHGHVGGVQAGEPSPAAMGNHLVLTVSGPRSRRIPRVSGTSTRVSATHCMSRCRCSPASTFSRRSG